MLNLLAFGAFTDALKGVITAAFAGVFATGAYVSNFVTDAVLWLWDQWMANWVAAWLIAMINGIPSSWVAQMHWETIIKYVALADKWFPIGIGVGMLLAVLVIWFAYFFFRLVVELF